MFYPNYSEAYIITTISNGKPVIPVDTGLFEVFIGDRVYRMQDNLTALNGQTVIVFFVCAISDLATVKNYAGYLGTDRESLLDSRCDGIVGNVNSIFIKDEYADAPDVIKGGNRPIDVKATTETKNLYQRLVNNKMMLGHQGFIRYDHPEYGEPIFDITGKRPIVLSLDYRSSTSLNRSSVNATYRPQAEYFTNLAKQHYKNGGILTFSWHMHNWVTGGNSKDLTGDPVTNILPNGTHRSAYLAKLDEFADWMNNFKDDNGNLIPVIFRPFHEQDGSWFWWGITTCTDKQFKILWRDLITYLRDIKNVHNLLYVICPENYKKDTYCGSRYPGNNFVDIIGIDVYSDSNDISLPQWTPINGLTVSPLERWRNAANAAKTKNKPFVICEGIRNLVDAPKEDYWDWIIDQFIEDPLISTASYISFWESISWGPLKGREDEKSFLRMVNSGKVKMLGDCK
jgi:hypothetical protein